MVAVTVTTIEYPVDGRAIWKALGRDVDAFDKYVDEFGWERVVRDDLLPFIEVIREKSRGR